ncbi:MAG: tRNA glutamyl-Q(34) synthetase GluQRS, partial [Alphaproteobacteria bacterium]
DDIITSYPGTCRRMSSDARQQRMKEREFAWRLDCGKALERLDAPLSWLDGHGRRHALMPDQDVIIARRDIGVSYHLATVIDDADQGITHIIRGEDLKDSLPIHRLLQALLGLPEPVYIHHRLVRDVEGRRLAKRSGATTLAGLRQLGVSAAALRHFLMHSPDLIWPDIENEPGFLKALADGSTDILGSPV